MWNLQPRLGFSGIGAWSGRRRGARGSFKGVTSQYQSASKYLGQTFSHARHYCLSSGFAPLMSERNASWSQETRVRDIGCTHPLDSSFSCVRIAIYLILATMHPHSFQGLLAAMLVTADATFASDTAPGAHVALRVSIQAESHPDTS